MRQADIEEVRYPELILQLAHTQGGFVRRKDVEELLHVSQSKAQRLLAALTPTDGPLELRGAGPKAAYWLREERTGRGCSGRLAGCPALGHS